jgi:hypothetical protein
VRKYIYEKVENELSSMIKRIDDEGKVCWIPTDPANSDYAEYLAQLEGEQPEA